MGVDILGGHFSSGGRIHNPRFYRQIHRHRPIEITDHAIIFTSWLLTQRWFTIPARDIDMECEVEIALRNRCRAWALIGQHSWSNPLPLHLSDGMIQQRIRWRERGKPSGLCQFTSASMLMFLVKGKGIARRRITMDRKIKILGIAGSLRKDSYNKALVRAAGELVLPDAEIETFDLEGIPPFNQDLDPQPPERVKQFKEKIRAADAILIATSEYNYSIPGVLKNAIDWASRPYGDSAWDGKPVALMGASVGMLGTARAQYHLRQCCVFLNMFPLNQPEVMVPFVTDKVDSTGRLTDQKTREKIAELLQSLVAWSRRLG
jgi:chromate reductase, NAD(P)H dehydrogenase (quinone)